MSYKASLACAGAFAAAAILAGSAFAADLAPPPPPVPVFTWTGLYVGGQIGYAWGQDPVTWSGYPRTMSWRAVRLATLHKG
jgi:opacity protein-like surface antigen